VRQKLTRELANLVCRTWPKVNYTAPSAYFSILTVLFPPPKWPILCRVGALNSTHSRPRATAGDSIVCWIFKMADNNRKWW